MQVPDWLDSTIIAAVVAAVVAAIGHFLNTKSRQDEITSTRASTLMEQQGKQIDRLVLQQAEDRARIGQLEKSDRETKELLWASEKYSRRLHGGLGEVVGHLDEAWIWIDALQASSKPPRPRLDRIRALLDEPRPRRPPPHDDEAT